MATTPKLMTAEELLCLPDDGLSHELIAGELTTMPPPGYELGALVALLTISLGQHVIANQLGRVVAGEVGFTLAADPDTVRAADVAFIGQARVEERGWPTGYWPGAPDLAIEVISPTDRYTEVEAKVAMWLAHETGMVIVVNPRQRTAAVHRSATDVRHLTLDDTLDGEEIMPGWRLPLRELFAEDAN
jgi:Uma2 family endonuclease